MQIKRRHEHSTEQCASGLIRPKPRSNRTTRADRVKGQVFEWIGLRWNIARPATWQQQLAATLLIEPEVETIDDVLSIWELWKQTVVEQVRALCPCLVLERTHQWRRSHSRVAHSHAHFHLFRLHPRAGDLKLRLSSQRPALEFKFLGGAPKGANMRQPASQRDLFSLGLPVCEF